MSHITACPHCSTQIRVPDWNTHKTLLCPRCLADVDNVWPGSKIRADDIHTDVTRDLRVGNIVLALLIGLCVFGIAIGYFSLRYTGQKGSQFDFFEQLMIFSFIALDLVVTIAIIRWAISGTGVPSVGRLFGTAFLVLCTALAVFMFFFLTCVSLNMKM